MTVPHVIDLRGLGESRALRESLLRVARGARADAVPHLEAVAKKAFEGLPFKIALLEGMGITETICRHAREQAVDVIVIASHGRTGAKRFILGSVAERVVQLAPCDVLVVRSGAAAEEEE